MRTVIANSDGWAGVGLVHRVKRRVLLPRHLSAYLCVAAGESYLCGFGGSCKAVFKTEDIHWVSDT